jgi:hypothetical protein
MSKLILRGGPKDGLEIESNQIALDATGRLLISPGSPWFRPSWYRFSGTEFVFDSYQEPADYSCATASDRAFWTYQLGFDPTLEKK